MGASGAGLSGSSAGGARCVELLGISWFSLFGLVPAPPLPFPKLKIM
jgi:hypothetical protein